MQGQPFRTIGPCDYGSVIAPETGKNINFFNRETLGLSIGKHTITIRYNGAAPDVLTSVIILK